MSTEGIKRRKAEKDRKEFSIRVRLTEEQKEKMTRAANKFGLDLSGWLRLFFFARHWIIIMKK